MAGISATVQGTFDRLTTTDLGDTKYDLRPEHATLGHAALTSTRASTLLLHRVQAVCTTQRRHLVVIAGYVLLFCKAQTVSCT